MWPLGFIEAVQSIKGGGGGSAAIDVVGGTTQPENASENTIWVNTDVPIGTWYALFNEPQSPVEGDVWLKLASSSFQIELTPEQFIVEISTIVQYIGGVWAQKTAQIYYGSAWAEANLNERVLLDATGWRSGLSFRSCTDYSDITIYNDEYPVSFKMYRYSAAYLMDIDFADYDVLEIDIESDYTSEQWHHIGVTDSTTYSPNYIAHLTFEKQIPRNVHAINVSSITGRHNIIITAWGQNHYIRVYGIKLRKNG